MTPSKTTAPDPVPWRIRNKAIVARFEAGESMTDLGRAYDLPTLTIEAIIRAAFTRKKR